MSLFGNLFKPNENLKEPLDLSVLGADMHSHFIPGIDDGSDSMEKSLEMARAMVNLGYKKLITTPHTMQDYYKNTPEIINKGLAELKKAINDAGIPLQVEAASEYLIDEGFLKKFHAGELLTFGNKYILVEISFYVPPENLYQVLFDLKLEGYSPILAHPERYGYWHHDFEKYITLKDREILLQINLPSLSGFYSPNVRKIAEQLIDNNMVDFVGTDAHNMEYIDFVDKSRHSKHLEKLLQSGKLLNNTL
jgi:tyrosine-protein phosphatase YwqE